MFEFSIHDIHNVFITLNNPFSMLPHMHELQQLLQVFLHSTPLKTLLAHAKEAIPLVTGIQKALIGCFNNQKETTTESLQLLELHCYKWLEGLAYQNKQSAWEEMPGMLADITEHLVQLYLELFHHFSETVQFHAVPLLMKQSYALQFHAALRCWKATLGDVPPQPLYFCCEKIIDEALSEAAILPFQQLHYLVQLVRGITRLGCPADEQSTRSLLQYLLFLNCNDPLIIENALLFWEKKANATNSIPEAIEQWMDAEQEILIWQQEQKPGLYTHKQSCGEVLLVLVKKSIQKLELWMQLQASAKEEKNCKKLHTCLNLSELAIVLRLLQETGVIRHTVMMEFLRCWAAWVEMEPGKPIAVDSLKTRYYSPEPAALRKIKDLFMEMRHKLAQW